MRLSTRRALPIALLVVGIAAAVLYTLWSRNGPAVSLGSFTAQRASDESKHERATERNEPIDRYGVRGARRSLEPPAALTRRAESVDPGLDHESEDRLILMKNLDEVLPHDKEIAARFDLPREELDRATSAQLSRHFAKGPLWIWFGFYDDVNIGIYRASRASATLEELTNRADMVDGVIEFFEVANQEISKPQPSPEMADFPLSSGLEAMDKLLMYPDVFEKTQGLERRLLQVLRDRHEAAAAANAVSIEQTGDELFSVSLGTAKALSLKLLARIDPDGYERWKTGIPIAEESDFFDYVSHVLSAP